MLCSEWSLIRQQGNEVHASPLYCNAWTCDVCSPRRKARLMREARRGKPNTFITLTVNPHWFDSTAERAQALKHAWTIIRRRARSQLKIKHIPFMAVFEKTKMGEPHLHILCRVKWIDQKWLSDQMKDLMGAPICDIRRVKNERQMAAYVTKYLTKDPQPFPGTKRYWRSLDYMLPMKEEVCDRAKAIYYIARRTLADLQLEAGRDGFSICEDMNRQSLFISWWTNAVRGTPL